MSRLFGTDGIRGLANTPPLTTELAFRLGRQLVATLIEHDPTKKTRLVVGRDTRLSGPMLEGALVSGALSAGGDVYAVGVLPTPAIAYLTRRLEAHGGVVLSASHNPFEDNGIKIFSSEGAKFPDAWEEEIEGRLNGPDTAPWPTGVDIGRLVVHEAAEADYIAHARASCPHDLRDVRIVLDCAHGATYRVAPEIFRRLGADVRVLNASPDGQNINRGVGRHASGGPAEGGPALAAPTSGSPSTATATGSSRWTRRARSATATTRWPSAGGISRRAGSSRAAPWSPP